MAQEYSLEFKTEHHVKLAGTYRFQSPEEYKLYFEPISTKIAEATEEFVIELKEVKFMNSSGISSLGKLLIASRNLNKPLKILASQEIPWQAKGLKSFEKLGSQIKVVIE